MYFFLLPQAQVQLEVVLQYGMDLRVKLGA